MLPEVGLTDIYTVPSRTFTGNASAPTAFSTWSKRSIRHIAAVLAGRDEDFIIKAMVRNCQLDNLLKEPRVAKKIILMIMHNISEHWTARLAVHLWDRLSLSRRECDTLRHLLSFEYIPSPVDTYIPLKAWVNPNDPDDFVAFPILPARHAREKEYAKLVEEGQIQVSASGHCQRDARIVASDMYAAYEGAMRTNFSDHRPAMTVYGFDGTGQSVGKGLCHGELGSADFSGDCKQSRKLQPLAASEGSDHAIPIRESMQYAADSYNKLIAQGRIDLPDGRCLPCRPIATGDMQAVKALVATAEQTHSVWCRCLSHTGRQHKYSQTPINFTSGNARSVNAAYARMLHYIEQDPEGPQCTIKTFDEQCKLNHIPPSVARGGDFSPFECPACGYAPTMRGWTDDVAAFEMLPPNEQAVKRKEHMENGKDIYEWDRHHFGVLFMSPMLHLDFEDIGVDPLHLVFLNTFKHLFNYTVHQPMPGASVVRAPS